MALERVVAFQKGASLRRSAFMAIGVLGYSGMLATEFAPPALAEESGRITIIEENDDLMPTPTDRWYTQGFELSY